MSVSRINLPRLSGESIAAKPAKGFGIDGNDGPPPTGRGGARIGLSHRLRRCDGG